MSDEIDPERVRHLAESLRKWRVQLPSGQLVPLTDEERVDLARRLLAATPERPRWWVDPEAE